jgi:hypothetical protein
MTAPIGIPVPVFTNDADSTETADPKKNWMIVPEKSSKTDCKASGTSTTLF